jgi:hypothetical protein
MGLRRMSYQTDPNEPARENVSQSIRELDEGDQCLRCLLMLAGPSSNFLMMDWSENSRFSIN